MTKAKMKTAPWREVRERAVRPEDEPHIAREREIIEAELRLAALRKHRKASQTAVAKRLKVSQSSVSQLERGADPRLSTVAGYVDALGGKLKVLAVFDDETVPIS
ncbi:MAG TPA: helix-turn-helix transcriptional regulator [Solirubrobacteraceae bacterium]|jgi:DNA-binding XRE family transcriptional regulator|nr:helix-turn-helix transcriptional regulator [Solirubrobacteraceae bacterium]